MATQPLNKLLGSILADVVRGERQAADASRDHMREVGFEGGRSKDDWGRIRFVRFSFATENPDGRIQNRTLRVPLLTLLPIPLQQVAQAEFEFFVRVSDVGGGKADDSLIAGDVAPYVPEGQTAAVADPRIKVKMTLKQSDLPAGLASSLRRIEETAGEPPKRLR